MRNYTLPDSKYTIVNKQNFLLLHGNVYKLSNMLNFNFDPGFFRRVISRSQSTERIPSISQLVKDATEVFYDEFDYYPEVGAYAPGVLTIIGDHMEYTGGKLIQVALPYGTVILGKFMNTVKCKVITTSKHVDGLKKSVFPVMNFKKNKSNMYPNWVTYVRGVLNKFPCENPKGFDALIHSSVPPVKGYGSSAALQVSFYTFLEASCGNRPCEDKIKRGRLCQNAEVEFRPTAPKFGLFSNITSSAANENSGVLINCCNGDIISFDMKEIGILFLLTYPNFEIEWDDRDLVPRREMELHLIARLLGLNHINQATEKHLQILENMEDPSKEAVIEILRGFGIDEDTIFDFVDELYYFPQSMLDLEFHGEGGRQFIDIVPEDESVKSNTIEETNEEPIEEKVAVTQCIPKPIPCKKNPVANSAFTTSYLNKRLEKLCAEKRVIENLFQKEKICDPINCLGGLENLSEASDLTVIGKLLRRLRHIITEKNRCESLPEIIQRGDYIEFGNILIQSHLSLKLDYQVCCPTLDRLVQLAIETEDVYGAKMMSGGGTLTLLHRSVAEIFIKKIKEEFEERNFQFHLVFPNEGAHILKIGVKQNPKSILSTPYLNKTELMKKAVQSFEATYKYKPSHGAYSPGVLNLIGDHADYNHGLSITTAISLLTVVVGAFNGTSKVRLSMTGDTDGEPKKIIFPLPTEENPLTPGRIKWAKLIKGVISHFEGPLRGFDCLIQNNIPATFGSSNQTVLVVAFYTFLEVLTDSKTEDLCKKAHACMYILQDFTNMTCGIGDPMTLIRAREDFALFLDCRSLTSTLMPFQDTSINLVMSFTEQKSVDIRCLLFSRMEDCYKVARALGGKTLRCVTLKQLDGLSSKKVSETAIRRAKHIILENERALRSAEALKNNDFESLGELMVASHNSLRYNFEVTTPELDFLVERAMEVDGVLGSKMACNGNSSCTVTLVKRWAIDDLIEYLQNSYGEKLDSYVVTTNESCGALNVKEYVESLPSTQFVFEDIFPY